MPKNVVETIEMEVGSGNTFGSLPYKGFPINQVERFPMARSAGHFFVWISFKTLNHRHGARWEEQQGADWPNYNLISKLSQLAHAMSQKTGNLVALEDGAPYGQQSNPVPARHVPS